MNSKKLFKEWEKSIQELSDKEIRYDELKREYYDKSEEIIAKTDFNELYGKNNKDVRKAHIEKVLKSMSDEIDDLKYSTDYLKRRIEFLKALSYHIKEE